jgi:hypothetical protein
MGDLGGITGTEIQAKCNGAGKECCEVVIETRVLGMEYHQDQI